MATSTSSRLRSRTEPLPRPLLAVVAGLCLTASIPPMGFWPAAFVGIAVFDRALDDTAGRRRFGIAWLGWFTLFAPTMFWMRDLTAPGYVIAAAVYAGFVAAGTMLAPRGAGWFVAFPAGVMVAEWVRWHWPFGGVPLSNLAIGQVAGPLAPILRIGGALLLVAATMWVGLALAALTRRRFRMAAALAALPVALVLAATFAPSGRGTGEYLDVALVQGGGPQGTRAEDTEPGIVLERHVAASADLPGPGDDRALDLVLWPENIIDVVTLTGSEDEARVQDVARATGATVLVGVVEDVGDDGFYNWQVGYGPDGDEIGRYDKVERVPFGEWVPFRSLLESVAGDALPGRDAVAGTGPAVIDTDVGPIGVSISWEIFFGERARAAIAAGGELLMNPTNGSSFTGTQVQTQQVASSRMRAIETGRWVTQVAPTGFSAVVTPDGDVRQRTAVSERAVLFDTVELRTGETLYVAYGDTAAWAVIVGGLIGGWIHDRRRRWG